MLKRHLPNLLSYFRHRITNATSEGFNSVIQSPKYAAGGFRLGSSRTRDLGGGNLFLNPHIAWYRKSNPVTTPSTASERLWALPR